ncbi:flavin reductase family protein [Carnimonas nigrificans]|uniref:flavin reductase family protein n=1 Tax=Carnimonas nigrificans TaxID=64323 RepID=UPI00046FBB31|nr:flavin reductase family protein [Carnimonas nigrificans]
MYFYRPKEGHGLAHDPFNAIIAPRPIGWISSKDSDGTLNLAPYSFFNAFNYVPPIIGFSSVGRKDSLTNIEATGEFVWNLASEALAEQMNLSCSAVALEVDEFALAGLAPAASSEIAVPRVAAAPVAFECRLSQIVQLNDSHGVEIESWLVLGEVVGIHIDQRLIVDDMFDTVAAKPLTRGGGPGDYFTISEAARFEMRRPQ